MFFCCCCYNFLPRESLLLLVEYSTFLGSMPFYSAFIAPPFKRQRIFSWPSSLFASVTCCGQYDASICEISRDLKMRLCYLIYSFAFLPLPGEGHACAGQLVPEKDETRESTAFLAKAP